MRRRCLGIGRGLATLAAAGLASVAFAGYLTGPSPNAGPPLLLRIDGVVETSAEAAKATGLPVASLGLLGQPGNVRRWLAFREARTVGGDNALDGKDVLSALAPFTPNLLVTGPDALVAEVQRASPGSRLRLEGLVNLGSRTYYLRTVASSDARREG